MAVEDRGYSNHEIKWKRKNIYYRKRKIKVKSDNVQHAQVT